MGGGVDLGGGPGPYNGRMKNKASRVIVSTLLFAAIAVVALNTWYAFSSMTRLLDSESLVQHTWQVIYQVELIISSVKDAETGGARLSDLGGRDVSCAISRGAGGASRGAG